MQLTTGVPSAFNDDTVQQTHETSEREEEPTTKVPNSFKDKVKGFVNSVKEGASDAFESVSDTVSEAAHKLDKKRKEAVAGTKKLVNGALDKIKDSYDSFKHSDESEETVPKVPESSLKEQAQHVVDTVKTD